MGKQKNALRGHFVQEWEKDQKEPGSEWLELADNIATITDNTVEATEEEGFYDGDGTPEETVTSVAGAYTVEGNYNASDPAQSLIAGLKYKIGEGRKVWHKIVSSDGKKEWVGPATVTGIVDGDGEATAYERFSCNIRFDRIPEETTPSGE